MKVSELIKELADCRPSAEVYIWFYDEHTYRVAKDVDLNMWWDQVTISDK